MERIYKITRNIHIVGKQDTGKSRTKQQKKEKFEQNKEKEKSRSLGCSYPVPTYLQYAVEKSERRSSAQKFLFLSRFASPRETEPSTLREHANKERHKDPSKHGM